MASFSSKTQPPTQRAGLVVRARLIEQLNAGLDRKLTLISASTGFGKTTLACAWAQKCGRPFAWLLLDELDNDPQRFLSYLIRALQKVQSSFAADLLESLKTFQPGKDAAGLDAFMEVLIHEVAALQTVFILVMDDYHLITNAKILEMLQLLHHYQPANLHLVLISRADPPWPMGRLRARRELNEIRAADLRFTLEESAEFLNTSMGLGLSAEQVAALEARTEGWIVGLQLAALSLQGQARPQEIIDSLAGSHRFIADYLVEEVLEKQAPEVQEFLLKTSVLDQLNAALCDEVTERSDSQATLRQLERANLFLLPLDQERNGYRYHRLFADLLRIKLEQTHPGLTLELQRRAAAWHSAQGRRLEALHYALAAGDWDMMECLFAGNIFLLFRQDEVGAALQTLEAIPPIALISNKPWLGIAHAFLIENGQFQKSHRILETVADHIETMPESAEKRRLRGHLEAAWAGMYALQGDVDNAVQHAQQAEAWLPPDEVEMRASNLMLWGDILSKEGHDPNAMPILERAMALALQAENSHTVVTVAAALAMGHLGGGRLHEAYRFCQQALTVAADYHKRTGQEILIGAMIYAVLARISIEWNEWEKSCQYGFKGLALSERLGQIDTEVMCREYLGHTLMFQTGPAQALQVYQRALELADHISPWVKRMVAGLVVDGLLDREPLDEAAMRKYLDVYDETHTEYPFTLKVRLLLKTGQPAAALAELEKALAIMNEEVARLAVRPHVFRALALQAIGDEAAALAALAHALTLAEPENRVLTFLREGRAMEKLLRAAERKAICPAFIHKLLAAFAQRRVPVDKVTANSEVEPLSERELEILHLLASDLDVPKIASKLVVSANTVRTHVKSLYRKLNAHSRHEALALARELKLA